MGAANLPTTIRAVYQIDPKLTTLKLTETPLPKPTGENEHLIKIKATAPCLGELGWEINYPSLFPPDRERVPGTEAAGVVATAPPSSPFQPGDEVYFRLHARYPGCLREYTIAHTEELALKPKTLDWAEAAATPLSTLTAWQGLFTQGILDKRGIRGDADARAHNSRLRVLITGAGGSVGTWAVQFAAAAGAGSVVAQVSGANIEAANKAGATEVIDYKKRSVEEWAKEDPSREVDLVLDCLGGPTLGSCWAAVKDGGVLLSIVGSPEEAKPEAVNKTLAKATWFLMDCKGDDLREIADFIDERGLKPQIDSVVEFEDFQAAYDKVEQGKAKGKVVIKVDRFCGDA
ncbi:NAD(P)-binding protein [Trichoderma citrinoviride]|uniref:NAD(P)-binding protein n=1 Tax=Trichoderma citrinoviride TaxID=58853 RepID=A0A2T4BBR9_9HYPO|nr:NAD(P)-binding protein [Trichoderma citrinoviride]PTB66783.1 NAD(P)-binding protein [Trichoderma citrinoviride]